MTRRLPKRPDARHHRWDLTSEATLDQTGTSDAPIELLETGIIKEDKLGLDVVYIQAKRWTRTVGRPEIQQFAGALAGQRARKGVFITTSTFSAEARSYVASVESKIVLIDGEQLAQFMFEHNVGVSPAARYEVKKIDADFFDED